MKKSFILSSAIFLSLGLFAGSSIINSSIYANSISNPISGPVSPTSTPISNPINPTPEPNNNGSNNNSGGSSNNGGYNSNHGPATCNDTKPGLPVLLSATKSGPNQVTLKWVKAQAPVTHYLLAYGVKPNQPIYGLPNATGAAADQFTVRGLSANQTYYFKVKAVNGCMPGDFSNELSSGQVAGIRTNTPARNFQNILSAKTETPATPAPSVINLPTNNNSNNNQGLGTKIINFFKGIFG